MKPSVTVCIPTYNGAAYLAATSVFHSREGADHCEVASAQEDPAAPRGGAEGDWSVGPRPAVLIQLGQFPKRRAR